MIYHWLLTRSPAVAIPLAPEKVAGVVAVHAKMQKKLLRAVLVWQKEKKGGNQAMQKREGEFLS